MTITSPHNERIKEIRKLRARRRERERMGRFVAEGEDLLAAADAAGWAALERFCLAGSGLAGIEVEAAVLARAAELASGTRALGVYAERWAPVPHGPLCVYLHGVHDPGNVGTILRSAEAFGASCVALGPGSADPFGPKSVRASMGAIFTVPVARLDGEPAALLAALPGRRLALDAAAPTPMAAWGDEVEPGGPRDAATPPPTTLLVGAERAGLPAELVEGADLALRIPIGSHSLNAAMAATIALYELTRDGPVSPGAAAGRTPEPGDS